ncbi:sugar phosphate isomerase/epimerase [Candidatus Poribacteria bacterium]|nr:sugar phosphate isomerase/epimerase [Candidatus Poribacteria bacterium]
MTASLGLKYFEALPTNPPPELGKVSEYKNLMEKHGVKIIAYGIVGLSNNEEQARPLFEFAKAMGIEMLTAYPEFDSFDLLDKLVEEFDVGIAIHNYGPGHRYADVETIKRVTERHHPKIGACLDTGHLTRAGGGIMEAVYAHGKRLHGVHLKDLNEKNEDVVIGTGVLPIGNFIKALMEIDFSGYLSLELETKPEKILAGIRQSLSFLQKVAG